MTGPVVCTPLRVEQAAVRHGAPGLSVLRTGSGRRRSEQAVDRFALAGRPLAVVGVAGAVAPGLHPADLVLATEVRTGAHRVELPAAPLLATALRRRGLTVQLGPIRSTAAIVHGPARADYAAEQLLAVDLESGPLVEAAAGQPAVVLRAVVDTPEHPLLRPGTAGRGWRALRTLAVAAPVLSQWQQALRPREVLLAEPRPQAVRAIAAEADLVLVLGSAEAQLLGSAEAQPLVEATERSGTTGHLVEDVEQIDLDWLIPAHRIGLAAGASTPAGLLDRVLRALAGLGPVTETSTVTDARFSLPKGVS